MLIANASHGPPAANARSSSAPAKPTIAGLCAMTSRRAFLFSHGRNLLGACGPGDSSRNFFFIAAHMKPLRRFVAENRALRDPARHQRRNPIHQPRPRHIGKGETIGAICVADNFDLDHQYR